jgi:hypothetical protein
MKSRGEIGEYALGRDGRVYMRTRSGIKQVPPSLAVGMIADDLRQRRREKLAHVAVWCLLAVVVVLSFLLLVA